MWGCAEAHAVQQAKWAYVERYFIIALTIAAMWGRAMARAEQQAREAYAEFNSCSC